MRGGVAGTSLRNNCNKNSKHKHKLSNFFEEKFFKKEIIIPLIIVFALDAAQIINQVFFWKVGRSFYSEGTGLRSMIKAYFQIPDPYYFNVIKLMFPRMFYVFMAGILFFIIFSIIISSGH